MSSTPFSIVYVVTLASFGFLVAVHRLNQRSAYAVIGLTAVIGTAFFLVASNAIGYLLPIQLTFDVVLGAMVLFDLIFVAVILWRGSDELFPKLEWPPRSHLWTLSGISLLCIAANVRFLGSDAWAWHHYPLAATISAGNFPVMEPVDPFQSMGYHYGPEMLAAAFHALTGLSLVWGFHLQSVIGVIGILFCAAALAKRLTSSWRGAMLAAILAIFGTGFVWFNGWFLLTDLIRQFLTGPHIAYPFRNLAPMFGSSVTSSLIAYLGHRSLLNGSPVLFALLLSLQALFVEKNRALTARLIALSIILAAALALTMETSLALLFPALVVYALFLLCTRSSDWKRVAMCSVLVIIPALLIARVQGGVLSSHGADAGAGAFVLGFHPQIFINLEGGSIPFWHWMFLRDFGLPLFLFPFALWWAWKSRSSMPFAMLVCILALGHFLAPFSLTFLTRLSDINRIFFIATSLFSFVAALWIDRILLSHPSRFARATGYVFIASMLIASTVYLLFRLTFPTFRFERAPLIAPMFPITAEERQLYDWVRANTRLNDFFYQRTVLSLDEGKSTMTDAEQLQADRILFMTYTGRYSVGPLSLWWYYPPTLSESSLAIEQSCDIAAFRTIHIKYLLVESADRAQWFSSRCTAKDWVMRYGNNATLPRVYELR